MTLIALFMIFAWPVFRENNIPVTLFVSTDIIDKKTKGYMTWKEIKSLLMKVGCWSTYINTLTYAVEQCLVIKNDILELT